MPCNNIAEVIHLKLDPDDKLIAYSLRKEACSSGVGEISLVGDLVISRTSSELLHIPTEEILKDCKYQDDIDEFLHWKHVLAIQSALAAMTGQLTQSSKSVCEVDELNYGPEGISLTGLIKIEALTEEIKACGGCSGCK